MTNKLAFAASGILIALVSAALSAVVSISYVAQPLQTGQGEFTESFLVAQTEALKDLRAGHPAKAQAYLEMVSAINLRKLGERKDAGAKVPSTVAAVQAVAYACGQAPTAASSQQTDGKMSFGEACVLLQKP